MDTTPSLDAAISSRISVVGNHDAGEYDLQISNVVDSDTGQYRCTVGNDTQPIQELTVIGM
jgi:hypothetical protein